MIVMAKPRNKSGKKTAQDQGSGPAKTERTRYLPADPPRRHAVFLAATVLLLAIWMGWLAYVAFAI